MSESKSKLSESDQKVLPALISKVKSAGRITLELLKEFKSLDISKKLPSSFYSELT